VGSGSGKTLLIMGSGAEGPEIANSVAASFKENLTVKREGEAKGGSGKNLHSLLATSSTFLMLVGFFLPLGLTLFVNRRRGTDKNPFMPALAGLGIAFVCTLLFDYVFLSRFSWTEASDYVQAMGSGTARFCFLMIVGGYLSTRWNSKS
jgi:hypothetical protein